MAITNWKVVAAWGIAVILLLLTGLEFKEPPPKPIPEKTPEPMVLATGWSTEEARRKNPLIAELPPSFETWQGAIFIDPIHLTFDNGTTRFEIDSKKYLEVSANNGRIFSLGIILPNLTLDVNEAIASYQQWRENFEALGLKPFTSKSHGQPYTVKELLQSFAEDSGVETGGTLGQWTDSKDYYFIGIQRKARSPDRYQSEEEKYFYTVEINIWDESEY